MKKTILIIICSLSGFALQPTHGQTTKNIVFVVMDGLRWQEVFNGADTTIINNKTFVSNKEKCMKKYWNSDVAARRSMLMPFLWSTVKEKGQIYGNRTKNSFVNVKNPFWFSYPGYNELLSGYADKNINSNEFGPNPNETILEALNKTDEYKGKVAAFTSWDAFNDIINEKRSGVYVNAGFEKMPDGVAGTSTALLNKMQYHLPDIFDGVRLDGATFTMGFEYMKQNKPRCMFLVFDETDDFAHGGRYVDYLNSAKYGDEFVKELWDWCQATSEYKDKTTFIITCDHGRGVTTDGWKSHGTKHEHSDETWFAIIGPNTPAKGEITSGQFYNEQLAKSIANLLNFDFKANHPIAEGIEAVKAK